MSHIEREIKHNHTNIPKTYLKQYHIPKINQKIQHKWKSMRERKGNTDGFDTTQLGLAQKGTLK